VFTADVQGVRAASRVRFRQPTMFSVALVWSEVRVMTCDPFAMELHRRRHAAYSAPHRGVVDAAGVKLA
jgi:hypothetical protein